MNKNRSIALFAALFILGLANSYAESEQSSTPSSDISAHTDIPSLMSSVDEKRAKKLARSAEKSIKKSKKRGDYIRHRLVQIDTSILTKRDPMPIFSYQEKVDKVWEFDMLFTPFEGETFLLQNKYNYVKDVSIGFKTYWSGTIRNMDGELVGAYTITELKGDAYFGNDSYFSFYNGDHYVLSNLGKKKEKVISQRKMWLLEKRNIDFHQERGESAFDY